MRSSGPPQAEAAEPPAQQQQASPEPKRRGSPLLGVLGLSLLLAGAGGLIVSRTPDPEPEVDRAGGDTPVNLGASAPGDISAHNSPTLVRNPVRRANLAVSNRIDTPFFSCALHVSFDNGRRWSQTAIPAPRGEEAKCFAPDVAFTGDGTLVLSFVTLRGRGNVPHAAWISTSEDGGRTLSNPKKVRGRLAFQMRLAADPVDRRRIYMTWVQGKEVAPLRFTEAGRNPVRVARSEDAGRSWSRPVTVSDRARKRVIAPAPAVGPKGVLYVLYLDLGGDRLDYEAGHRGRGGTPYQGKFKLVLARSADRGKTWEESPVDERIAPIERFIVFIPALPSIAVDRAGRVYAAFHDGRLGDPDVSLWALDPGSSGWRGPIRVNDTRPRDGRAQYLPKLSVAPDGRLDVLYYDRRSDPKNVLNQVSYQASFDAGRSFTPALSLASRRFSSKIGYGAKEGLPDLGSRLGLVSGDRQALAVWTDTRAGTAGTQKQDLAQARVAVSDRDRFSDGVENALRYGGVALALAGLGLLALWLRGPRRRGDEPPGRAEGEPPGRVEGDPAIE